MQGIKETKDKLYYELDFEFIKQMAEQMSANKTEKYPLYNWKNPIEVDKLKQALFRHVIALMSGETIDEGRTMGHLESIACNAMMINYQLKHHTI